MGARRSPISVMRWQSDIRQMKRAGTRVIRCCRACGAWEPVDLDPPGDHDGRLGHEPVGLLPALRGRRLHWAGDVPRLGRSGNPDAADAEHHARL
jgi:hypothetical protein